MNTSNKNTLSSVNGFLKGILESGIAELVAETGISKMKAIRVMQENCAKSDDISAAGVLELLCEIKWAYIEELGLCPAGDAPAFIEQVERDAGA